jgi:hypothetical protein
MRFIVPDWPKHNRWHLHNRCNWHRWGFGRNAIGQVAVWTPLLVILIGDGHVRQQLLREYYKAEGFVEMEYR